MMAFDSSTFRSSDMDKSLKDLSNSSLSLEKVEETLKNLLTFASQSESLDDLLTGSSLISTLIRVYERNKKTETVKNKIASILTLIGQKSGKKDCDMVVIDALTNILTCTDSIEDFVQCIDGINEVTGRSSSSGSCNEDSSSTHFVSHSLSMSSATAVFTKTKSMLLSSVKEGQKVEALDGVISLVDSGALNQAIDFSVWSSQKNKCAQSTQSSLLLDALAGFTETLKTISLWKKRTTLVFAAEKIFNLINENKFFPPEVSLPGTVNKIIAHVFMKNTAVNPSIVAITDTKVVWTGVGYNTFFVDEEIVQGLYKAEIEIKPGTDYSSCAVGFCPKSKLSTVAAYKDSYPLWSSNIPGTCGFYYHYISCVSSSSQVYTGTLFPNDSSTRIFGLELDADKKTFSVFVDGTQIPHIITNVPTPVHFAVFAYHSGTVVELKSVQKLSAPTTNPALACKQYGWK